MKRQSNATGFTIVEIVIAMAIMGILLSFVVSVQSSTFKSADQLMGSAQRLSNLEQATVYMASRVQEARAISTSATVNGQSCNITDTNPCFVVQVAEYPSDGNSITNATYKYLVYRFIPRAALSVADRSPNEWADSNTYAVSQSQQVICYPDTSDLTRACDRKKVNPDFTNIMTPAQSTNQVVIDMLTKTASDGSFAPFAYDATKGQFTFQFRQANQQNGNVVYTPTQGPYKQIVQRRN